MYKQIILQMDQSTTFCILLKVNIPHLFQGNPSDWVLPKESVRLLPTLST